jgi:uncharacterized protein YukE
MQILSMAPVTVVEDPRLLAAQPTAMASVANDMASMARALFATSSAIGGAVSRLESNWMGKGGPAFKAAADPTSGATAGAAEALFGAAGALSELADGIGDAQRLADSARRQAEQANWVLAQLQRSVQETELHGPGGGPELFGFAPTGAQVAAAQRVLADQEQASRLMALANSNAQAAWQAAQRAFDLMASQSPSVGAALDNTNVGVYNAELDRLGMAAMVAFAAGAFGSGDDDDDDDDAGGVNPREGEGEDGDDGGQGGAIDPLDQELMVLDDQADAKIQVDGTLLDQNIADDYNTIVDGDQSVTSFAEQQELRALHAPAGTFQPPAIYVNRHGQLTNGRYTLLDPKMAKHLTGSLSSGKSQWLYEVDSGTATLDAAAYADANNLWVGIRAKVPVVNGYVGVGGRSGKPTSWINVYRKTTGLIHGSPGGPP